MTTPVTLVASSSVGKQPGKVCIVHWSLFKKSPGKVNRFFLMQSEGVLLCLVVYLCSHSDWWTILYLVYCKAISPNKKRNFTLCVFENKCISYGCQQQTNSLLHNTNAIETNILQNAAHQPIINIVCVACSRSNI